MSGMPCADPFSPSKFAPRVGIWTPVYYVVSWAHTSSHHLDRFNSSTVFAGPTVVTDKDKQTDRRTN